MIVRHKVADFNTWKSVFDEMHETRHQHGWIGHEVLRDADDGNYVTIVNKMGSLEQAKAYGQSPGLKQAMQRAGVISAPDITFLNDDELISY